MATMAASPVTVGPWQAQVPEELFDYVRTDYLPALKKYVLEMQELNKKNDILGIRQVAHKIVGSAMCFGLQKVA